MDSLHHNPPNLRGKQKKLKFQFGKMPQLSSICLGRDNQRLSRQRDAARTPRLDTPPGGGDGGNQRRVLDGGQVLTCGQLRTIGWIQGEEGSGPHPREPPPHTHTHTHTHALVVPCRPKNTALVTDPDETSKEPKDHRTLKFTTGMPLLPGRVSWMPPSPSTPVSTSEPRATPIVRAGSESVLGLTNLLPR